MITLIPIIWIGALLALPLDTFTIQTAMGLSVASLYFSYLLGKIHWQLALAYTYFSITAISRFIFPVYFFPGFDLPEVVGFESLVMHAHLYLTCIALTFYCMRDEDLEKIEGLFLLFGILDSLAITIKFISGKGPYFLFNNPAIDVSFISCLIPICLKRLQSRFKNHIAIILFGMFVAPCIYTVTSSGILGLGIGVGTWLVAKNKFKSSYLTTGAIIALSIAMVGFLMQGSNLVASSGRYNVWGQAMEFWWRAINKWFGAGAGTYYMMGPAIQVTNADLSSGHAQIAGFFWLHNDWLQILFETGIIGLLLTISIFALTLNKAKRFPEIFAGLLTFGAIAIIQMPLRWILFSCLGAFFIRKSFSALKES